MNASKLSKRYIKNINDQGAERVNKQKGLSLSYANKIDHLKK
jgi:hypothetical protein